MGLSHSPRIVTSGLVGYWDAGNPKSYPGSGTSWYDISGYGNHGTLTNGPTYNSGIISLSGTNSIVLPSQNSSSLPVTGYGNFTGQDSNPFTLEIYIKTSQISGSLIQDSPALIGRDNGDVWGNLNLYQGYVYYIHYTTSWQSNIKSTTMVSDDKWHHVTYVNNSDKTGILYIDGKSESSGSSQMVATPTRYFVPSTIGRGYNNKFYIGSIGLVKFYDKSLSAAEVSQNFNALRGRFGL